MSTIDTHTSTTGVSRRTALRGAAWTASAVTVVVATPNFAAASGAIVPPTGTTTKGTAVRSVNDANVQQVIWTFTLKNTGVSAITNLQGTFTGPSKVIGLTVKSKLGTPPGATVTTWGGSGITTKTYPTTLAAGGTLTLTVTYLRDANSPGSVSATFSAGTPLAQMATAGTTYA